MTKTTHILPFMTPVYDTAGDYTDTVIRVTTGLFLVPHGAQKLFGWFGGYGLEATGQYFESIGLSNGYLVALSAGSVEFFGGLALALGLLTRISAVAAFVLLAVAITIHLPNGFMWTDGGLEYPLMWAIFALYFVVKGGGNYSLDRLIGKEF
jgi:putative oxidoreductase